jgi:hypothetical protein
MTVSITVSDGLLWGCAPLGNSESGPRHDLVGNTQPEPGARMAELKTQCQNLQGRKC